LLGRFGESGKVKDARAVWQYGGLYEWDEGG
jgi:hypothetical protein